MKLLTKIAIGLGIIGGAWAFSAAHAAPVTQGSGGGTGFGSTSTAAVGKCLQVASTSPFLTYQFGTCSGGGGSGSFSATGTASQIVVFTSTSAGLGYPNFTFNPSTGQLNASSVQASILDQGGQVFNVKAYGAKGDGVADDTSAVQATINAAEKSGGGVWYCPNGTYNISSILNVTSSNMELNFAPGCVMKATAALTGNFKDEYRGMFFFNNPLAGATQSNIWMHGGTIDMNNQRETNALAFWGSGGNVGASIDNTSTTKHILVENMSFINKASSTNAPSMVMLQGGDVGGIAMGTMSDVTFRNNTFRNGDMDMLSYYGDGFDRLNFLNNNFITNGRWGIVQNGYIKNTNSNITVDDNKFLHTMLTDESYSLADFHDVTRTGGTNLHIERNVFDNTGDPFVSDQIAINIHGWSGVYIDYNTFNSIWEAISLGQSNGGGAFQQDGNVEAYIDHNTFENLAFTPWDDDASYRLHIDDNTFKDNGLNCFAFYSKHEYTILQNNLFYDCNTNIGNDAILAVVGENSSTVPNYQKAAIEIGGSDALSVSGNIVVDDRVLLNPGTTASRLATSTGGSLATTTYYVKISFSNATGETLPSTEISSTIPANQLLKVFPDNPQGYATTYSTIGGIRAINIYVATSSGAETRQVTLAYPSYSSIINGWVEPVTGLIASGTPSGSNTTHALTAYGVYYLPGYIGVGPNIYSDNQFHGIATPFSGDGPDPGLQLMNTSGSQLLAVTNQTATFAGNISTTIPSALLLAGANGVIGAFGGSTCSAGQAFTGFSATGSATCAPFGSISTSSPITVNTFPFWTSDGKLSGSSTIFQSGGNITVSSTLAAQGLVLVPNSVGLADPDVHTDGSTIYLEAHGAGSVYFRNNGYGGTNMMAINPNGQLAISSYVGTPQPNNSIVVPGQIGIGTPSPSSTLHVIGTGQFSGNVGVGQAPVTEALAVNGNIGMNGYTWQIKPQGDANWGLGMTNIGNAYYDRAFGAFSNTDSATSGFQVYDKILQLPLFYVNGLGRTCIGTGCTAPSSTLDVAGDATIATRLAVGTTTTSTATLNINAPSATDGIRVQNDQGSNFITGYVGANQMFEIRQNNSNNNVELQSFNSHPLVLNDQGNAVIVNGNSQLGGATFSVAGSSQNSGAISGSSTLNISGTATLGSTTVQGNATTTNLSITALAGASGCASFSATGAIQTSTCSGGSGNVYALATSTILANNFLQFKSAGSSTVWATSSIFSIGAGSADISIGTTTDLGLFGMVNSAGTIALQVASTTNGTSSTPWFNLIATSSIFQILGSGHINATGTTPVLSACGTSPSIKGSDTDGEVTVGSVSATSCTITFQIPYEATPTCVVTSQTAAIAVGYSYTTTALTVTNAALTSDKINYSCKIPGL